MGSTRTRTRLVACLAIATLAAGCGGAEGAGDQENVDQITVGALPVADYAPVYYAAEKGLFEEQGLDVEVVQIQGGANSVPALLNGDFGIAVTNWTSYIQALDKGIPVRAVVPSAKGAPGYSAIVAAPGSGIEKPDDLAGTTVAVNNLRSIAELTGRIGLQENGVDPDQVEFTELPLPDMAPALERGSVDAAWVVEPFLGASVAAGASPIVDPFAGELDGMPLGSLTTSEEFAAKNPETLDRFASALGEAREALSDDATFREFLPSFTGLSPKVASTMTLPTSQADLDPAALERMVQRMDDFGWVEGDVDVASSLEYLHDVS